MNLYDTDYFRNWNNQNTNNQNTNNQNNTGLFDYRNALGDNWAISSNLVPTKNLASTNTGNLYDDSEHYPITQDAEKTGILESLKNKLGNIPFPSIAHLINKTTRPGADLSFAGYPDGTASRGGLYATEVANMQKLADMGALTAGGKDWISGKNVVSGFGNYNEGMQKSLERFEKTAAAHEKAGKFKGYGEDEDPLDKLAAYYKNNKLNATLQRLTHAQQMTGGSDGNNWITKTDGTDGTDGGTFKTVTSDPNYGYDDSGFTGEGFGSESTGNESPAADSGGWGDDYASEMIAEGGRVGYNRGRVVNPGGYNGVIDRNIANLKAALEYSELSAEERAQLEADLQMSIEAKGGWEDQLLSGDPVSKAQGGLIGYFDGGIAGLL